MSDLIFSYSRKQAIHDGLLIDVSLSAKEAGILYPVTLTQTCWLRCVRVPKELEGIQDEQGRLWDVLWVLFSHAKVSSTSEVFFDVLVQNHEDKEPESISLWAKVGPGDNSEPVVTVMLVGED